ncbi:hypothetical protein BY458DRAFT_527089 [Sporodiniella umbellata]|nr:hypothetical protein BY458DRAFT_527089 [Sporodiniella umbellata]
MSQIPELFEQIDQEVLLDTLSISTKPNEKKAINTLKKESKGKKVTFSSQPPTVYEYEAESEYREPIAHTFFNEGWCGRAKEAMSTTGFMDFKSKIEAQLGAINHPSLMSQLDQQPPGLLFTSHYKNRKSPLVQPLSLCAESELDSDDGSLSSSNDSPTITTPSDTMDSWLSPLKQQAGTISVYASTIHNKL